MQIIKQRLKKDLNNKIIKDQIKVCCLFFIPRSKAFDNFTFIQKKLLSKVFILQNFRQIHKYINTYPLYYATTESVAKLLVLITKFKKHIDFNSVFICGIQVKEFFFKSLALFHSFYNPLDIFFKLFSYTNRSIFYLKGCLNPKKD